MPAPMPLDAFSALRPGPGTASDVLEAALTERPETAEAVRQTLDHVGAVLADAAAQPERGRTLSLSPLDAAARGLLADVLGNGDVKAKITMEDGREVRIQEAVMPGLWRVLDGAEEWLEVGAVPPTLDARARALPQGFTVPDSYPEGVMNVAPVLEELRAASEAVENGGEGCEINLSLLPMTPVDMMMLDGTIGVGPIEILSLGHGNCRITACAHRHLWTVRYYNPEDKMILNVVQAGPVPVAAQATGTDMADGAERLTDIMAGLFT